MVMRYELPPPAALDINDSQASEKWKKYKLAWTNYAMVTELARNQTVQGATLLTVKGEEAREAFSMFTDSAEEGDATWIDPVMMKFPHYSAMQECAI